MHSCVSASTPFSLLHTPLILSSPPSSLLRAPVNLVPNPSFEQLGVAAGIATQTVVKAGFSNSSTIVTGWTVTDGQVSVWKSLYNVSYHGTNSLLLGLDCR